MSQNGPQPGGPEPERTPLPLELEQEIDRVSDEFERAWQVGPAPRIEDYLDRVPPAAQLRLLEELLVLEFDLQQQASTTLDVQAYRERFRGREAAVEAALAAHERHRHRDAAAPDGGPCDEDPAAEVDHEEPADPAQIGRFQVRRRLGRGGFGVVYLAHDPGLDRLVALKVPRGELLKTGQQRENFLHEARTAAKLKHSALVTVYEVQQDGDQIYIVQEYIEGQNLSQWAAAQPRSWEDIAHRMVEITTAMGYVHQQGFYHRDLKPGNILIDSQGHAHVADFGLAVHEDALRMLKGKASGTPQYMSPEQVRGETHWIDNRTDIWALGVILYELVAGQRPFTAPNRLELLEEIRERDPKSPRTKNPAIPKELERICLKCLAKRRTHRYGNASDLLEDLEAFLATCPDESATGADEQTRGTTVEPRSGAAIGTGSTVGPDADSTPRPTTPTPDSGSQPPLKIVPKGLRSFDEDDKDFFLELLPGPRDREGLPDSIRFWKTRIEKTDADKTFAVGVMYGPSGCGKSSLVKAGLLPHLASHVLPIFIEATPADTELRLLKRLRKHVPRLATEASLTEALAQLREGRATEGRKVLLVLDQFEQWLHATANLDSSQLVCALRQCDGANVQCLVLVRDDFWMSTTLFMQALEIPQLEGINSAAVNLFAPSHARKVLRAFGFAYGRLPEHELLADEQQFLDHAVEDLAHDGKVICVQLSLFADMMKDRLWTPASLQEVGGTSGVGVAFLDETFTAKTAPPTHRLHAKAAQAVLKALLPEVGTDIKGQMQPAEHLLECSGYSARPDDFRDLLQILNAELRLITPTEPEEAEAGVVEPTSAPADQKFYQLTHDYLVPSLRDWLTRKQKETRRGRAQLRLVERSAMWAAKPEHRHLPSWWEYLNIRALARGKDWTDSQRKMMRTATRHYGLIGSGALALFLIAAVALQQFVAFERRKSVDDAMVTLQAAHGPAVPVVIDNLRRLPRSLVKQELHSRFDSADDNRKLSLAYALADPDFGQVNRPFLIQAMTAAPGEECDNIATALAHDCEPAVAELKNAAATATTKQDWKLKTRLATVSLYLNDTTIAADMLRTEPPVTDNAKPVVEAKPDWHDVPLDPNWAPVADATKAEIAAGHGLLEEHFAYCLDMPWNSFLTVIESMRPSGYRPTRVRPFVVDGQRRAAAVWARDALPFQLEYDRTPDQLPSFDAAATREGLVPVDAAGYLGDDGAALYCLLWAPPVSAEEQRRLRVGMAKDEWSATNAQMEQAGFHTQVLQASVGADGTRRCAAIWSNQGAPTQATAGLTERQISETNKDRIIWEDLSVAVAGRPPHPLEQQRQILASLAALPPDQQDTPGNRLARGKARYYLDQPQEALVDLDALAAQSPPKVDALLYAVLCRAQLGQAEEAKAAMAKMARRVQIPSWNSYGSILMHAWLGHADEAKRGLDELVKQDADNPSSNDSMTLYTATCVAAQFIRILKDSPPEDIAVLKQRALDLLKKYYARVHSVAAGIENDPDFAPLFDDPTFQTLAAELVALKPYVGVVRTGRQFESMVEVGGAGAEQQQAARARIAENWRLVAVAVHGVANQTQPQVTVIWRRPRLAPPPIRPWDPVQRTLFIENFPTWSGSVEKLVDVLQKDDNVSLRSGFSLALGSLANPSVGAKKAWEPVLGDWYGNQPDKGIHGATKWALRTWNLTLPTLEQGTPPPTDFPWRVTQKGLTMLRISAGEVQTLEDRDSSAEPKTIRIASEFWLSDCEVTAGLFAEFERDPQGEKPQPSGVYGDVGSSGDNLDLPVVRVSWYDAVLFCNWLSQQEGIQPCYEQEGKETLRDYDNKTREHDAWKLIEGANGYRLPTKAQWEYACRARTTTAFGFGDDEELLDRYAVFAYNVKGGPSVGGSKLCNAWGLFDLHGNVREWCQDWYIEGSERVSRGGGWGMDASDCQSASHVGDQPDDRNGFLGFRVAAVPSSK